MKLKWGGSYVFNEPDVHAGIDIHADPGDVITVSEPMGAKLLEEGGGLWTEATDADVVVPPASPKKEPEPISKHDSKK